MARQQSVSVFEKYAHEYDLITNAAQREKYHQEEVDAIIARYSPTHVLDAGCATGLTTMLFGRRGVAAVGLDRSRPMLAVARKKFAKCGLSISFVQGSFQKLPQKLIGQFDLVACLANSISGVQTKRDLKLALAGFYRALRPGGTLVLQMLNYFAVTEDVLVPIKATRNEDIVYERFSERRGNRMSVYVTRADFADSPPAYEVFRHDFDNYDPKVVTEAMQEVGFGSLRRLGDLRFENRFSKKCRDLVVVATRAA
ncbi:MAG: class I SAM-dependent methyltransferase [bacterium]